MSTSDCGCGRICIGREVTEARNWNPDCPEHGVATAWYQSPEEVAYRAEQNASLRKLQLQAREARKAVR
jgi:hypothetical protein